MLSYFCCRQRGNIFPEKWLGLWLKKTRLAEKARNGNVKMNTFRLLNVFIVIQTCDYQNVIQTCDYQNVIQTWLFIILKRCVISRSNWRGILLQLLRNPITSHSSRPLGFVILRFDWRAQGRLLPVISRLNYAAQWSYAVCIGARELGKIPAHFASRHDDQPVWRNGRA